MTSLICRTINGEGTAEGYQTTSGALGNCHLLGQNLVGVPDQDCWDHCSQHLWDTATFPDFRKRHLRLGSTLSIGRSWPCPHPQCPLFHTLHRPWQSWLFFSLEKTGTSCLSYSWPLAKVSFLRRTALVLPLRLPSSPCPHSAPLFRACSIPISYSIFPGFFTNYNFWDYKDILFISLLSSKCDL